MASSPADGLLLRLGLFGSSRCSSGRRLHRPPDVIYHSCFLTSANFRGGNFQKANFENASLRDTDFTGADLSEADLEGVDLSKADLREANLSNTKWEKIADLKLANIHGVRNAPPNFLAWATAKGAVSIESDAEWAALCAQQ